MTTKLNSITVRSSKKLNRIMTALKAAGRRAFYEEMYDYDGKIYVLFYR